jgi:hypothetical protein
MNRRYASCLCDDHRVCGFCRELERTERRAAMRLIADDVDADDAAYDAALRADEASVLDQFRDGPFADGDR